MWLFDDILKKPVNQTLPNDPLGSGMGGWSPMGGVQGSGQPPQDDHSTPIFIEKSSEETVFWADSEAASIEAMNAPALAPTAHAEEDTSSILMSSTPTPVEVTPMVTEVPPLPIVEAVVMPEMVPTPLIQTAPIATIESPAVIEASPTIAEMPVVTATSNASIFDSIMSAPSAPTETQAVTTAPMEMVVPEVLVPTTVSETTPVAAVPVTAAIPMTPATTIVSTHSFATPREFIEKSIANIDVMMTNIDTRHNAKEIEEESYRIEKLRFTELEQTAHTEKIIMDKERAHAVHMRKILEAELVRDESNKSPITHVESTLTALGTEHAIHRHGHKKSESQKEEITPTA